MPCAVAGLLSLVLLTVVTMGLQEVRHFRGIYKSLQTNRYTQTLPAAIKRQQQKISRQSSIDASETTTLLNHGDGSAYNNSQLPSESVIPDIPDSEESSPSIRSLLTPRLIILLINYTFLALVDQSHQVLLPLTYSTSIPLGGLGFDPFTIGAIMGTWGMVNGITQSIIFAPLVEKLGARRLYVVAFACMLLVFPAYPLMSFLTKRAGGIVDAWVWTVLIMQLACNSMLFLCYGQSVLSIYSAQVDSSSFLIGTMQLYLVDSAPSKSAYGTTNGIAQMTASLCRSVSPALASSLYAISLEHNLLGGSMVFCILWIITLAGVFASLHIPRAFTHPQ